MSADLEARLAEAEHDAAHWEAEYDAAVAKIERVEALAHSWAEDDEMDPAYALWLLAALGTADNRATRYPSASTIPQE